jgi:hypothetical protein
VLVSLGQSFRVSPTGPSLLGVSVHKARRPCCDESRRHCQCCVLVMPCVVSMQSNDQGAKLVKSCMQSVLNLIRTSAESQKNLATWWQCLLLYGQPLCPIAKPLAICGYGALRTGLARMNEELNFRFYFFLT